jgi:hypothetical protein
LLTHCGFGCWLILVDNGLQRDVEVLCIELDAKSVVVVFSGIDESERDF